MKNGRVTRFEDRDYEVLGALEKWGVLGFGQLDGLAFRRGASPEERVRLFFNESRRSDYWLGAYKRLRTLEIAGYIRLAAGPKVLRYYLLTRDGHRVLQWRGKAAMFRYRREMPEMFLHHEIQVNAVGLALTELLGLTVWTAREWFAFNHFDFRKLRGSARLTMPDLRIQNAPQPTAVEVELGQKSRRRYERIWGAYRAHWPSNRVVLYLVDWPKGRDMLMELARRWFCEFIYVAHLDEFKKEKGRCLFLRREHSGRYFSFDLSALRPSQNPEPQSSDLLPMEVN